MTQPYREAEIVVPLTPIKASSPLVGFQQYAKALATIGVYRQDIEYCTNATNLDTLKLRCRKLMERSAEQQLLDKMRGFSVATSLADAAAWLQELTVDDLQYFREVAVPPSPSLGFSGAQVSAVCLVCTLLGFAAGCVFVGQHLGVCP